MNLALLTTSLLAAAAPGGSGSSLGWRPFLTPMPIWDYWFWTLLPLAAGIAVVYKTTKTHDITRVPRESAILTAWIVLGLIAAAIGVGVVVRFA